MDSGFGPELSPRLDQAFADNLPEVVWTDNMHNGYVRLDLDRRGALASFVTVDTVASQDYRPGILRRYAIHADNGQLKLELA